MASILCARNRLGRSIVEAMLADFDRNGRAAVEALRAQDPAAYGKTLCDLLATRDLLRQEERGKAGNSLEGHSGRTPRSRQSRGAMLLLDALLTDFAAHGPETIARLRMEKPQAWARRVAEAVQFRMLVKESMPAPKRQPRPIRMKELVAAMTHPLILDLDDPILPQDKAEALQAVVDSVSLDALSTMSSEGMLQHFDDAMAIWVWRWLGAGRDGRTVGGTPGSRSRSHGCKPQPSSGFFCRP